MHEPGRGCARLHWQGVLFFESREGRCGKFDDVDFSARAFCCDCVGGVSYTEPVTEAHRARVPVQRRVRLAGGGLQCGVLREWRVAVAACGGGVPSAGGGAALLGAAVRAARQLRVHLGELDLRLPGKDLEPWQRHLPPREREFGLGRARRLPRRRRAAAVGGAQVLRPRLCELRGRLRRHFLRRAGVGLAPRLAGCGRLAGRFRPCSPGPPPLAHTCAVRGRVPASGELVCAKLSRA